MSTSVSYPAEEYSTLFLVLFLTSTQAANSVTLDHRSTTVCKKKGYIEWLWHKPLRQNLSHKYNSSIKSLTAIVTVK